MQFVLQPCTPMQFPLYSCGVVALQLQSFRIATLPIFGCVGQVHNPSLVGDKGRHEYSPETKCQTTPRNDRLTAVRDNDDGDDLGS